MMNQRKNAFTLIELLAVIIILAAIALIVAPLVLDIIKEQQMKTFKESINGILRSSRLEIVNSGLSFPATFTYSDGKLISPTGKELKVTGKIPEGTGSVIYNSEDDLVLGITDNTWCGKYDKNNKEVMVEEYTGECDVIVYTPESCFEYEEYERVEYVLHKEQCSNYLWPELCEGIADIEHVASIDEIIEDKGFVEGFGVSLEGLETEGAITVTSRVKDGLKITNYKNENSECPTDVKIPKKIAGKPVRAIGEESFSERNLTNVIIPEGVVSIGYCAFCYNQLTNIAIPNSVKRVGDYSFKGNLLTNVILGNSVQVIERDAFGSNQLTGVTIPESVTNIGSWGFEENQLSTINIPTNVEIIGRNTFYKNKLVSVTIPTNVNKIGIEAFSWNELTSVTIQGKSSSADFTIYPDDSPFDWAEGYSDDNIIWNG